MNKYIAIDIGGTEIKYGILNEMGDFMEKSSCMTPSRQGGPAILKTVLDIIMRIQNRVEISGVCISTMGVVDTEKGEIIYAGKTAPNYAGISYKKTIEDQFAIPCEVENDVNCAGLAEYLRGAGRGSRNMVCITVGTGIGGCAVLDGKVLHGASDSAMEVGYLPVGSREFQDIGATSTLCRKVAERKQEPENLWNGRRIFETAQKGDQICEKAIDEMCDALGKGIGGICYILNPDVVVLGGGIMAQKEYLEPRIDKALKRYLKPMAYQALGLRFAALGNDAGMIGAFLHFMERQKGKRI